MSQYSVPVGNNGMGGGEDIIPLTKQEAIEWLEKHGGEDALEEYFSEAIEEA